MVIYVIIIKERIEVESQKKRTTCYFCCSSGSQLQFFQLNNSRG